MILTTKKRISVIVPIYNSECYLPDCIDSILKQTFENMQIILVDDGSTDRSGKICDAYEKMDSRITVIHKNNGGVSTARNAGIKIANGDFICFVDSDDLIEKEYFQKLLRAQEEYSDAFITGTYRIVRREETGIQTQEKTSECHFFTKADFGKLLEMGVYSCVFNKLFRREIIALHSLSFIPGIHYGEDGLFCLMYMEKLEFDRIVLINQAGYLYVQDVTNSLSKGFHRGMYHTVSKMNHRIIKLSEKWMISDELVYKFAVKGIETSLLDYMQKANPKPFWMKYRCCNQVLRSRHYNYYLKKAGESFGQVRRMISRTHNILLLMVYIKLCNFLKRFPIRK